MGFSRDELAHARGARRRARRGGADRAERLLPERRDRPGDGRRPGRDGARGRARAPADRQAADREAHAQRHRPARGGRGRRGRRRGRRLADQHAQGHGARPAHRRSRGSAAGTGGVSGPAVRAIALEQVRAVAARGRHPGDRHGRHRQRARTRPISSPPGRAAWRSGPRASAIRPPAGGSRRARRDLPPPSRPSRTGVPRPIRGTLTGVSRKLRELRGYDNPLSKTPANADKRLKYPEPA